MSKTRADELIKLKKELCDKFEEACAGLDKAIAKAEDDGAEKTVTEGRLTAMRESQARQLVGAVALKAGEGRTGTMAGIAAARMLPRRGGPPSE